jgi:hypothetical protein
MLFLLFPVVSEAQGILQSVNGFFDLTFTTSSSKSTDSSGNTVKTDSIGYNPRFSLAINTQIFPNINLSAGGRVEEIVTRTSIDGVSTKSTGVNLRPYINLLWKSDPFTVGVGYNRREEYAKSGDTPGVTNINDEYNAVFGWKPDGLPSVDILLFRRNFYDQHRQFQDTTTDSVLLATEYRYKGLDVRYQANYDDQDLKLFGLETKALTQTGKITYSDSFFDRRVSFNTSYNITRQDTTVTSEGKGGEVTLQAFPFAGLSINFEVIPPQTQHSIALNPNPALIDGNLTASAGINIGLPPPGGDTTARHMGLDLLNVTGVNNLLVWVDRELPSNIANAFSWDIYTSSDNLTWNFYMTISPAPFGQQFQNRFELDFPAVNTRYIKVVTKPLAPSVIDASSFPNIFITELQTFIKKPAGAANRTKTANTSQFVNVDAKARILDIPLLYYDFSYFYSRSDPAGLSQYTLSNGLSMNHRFSQVFSGTARVAREDSSQQGEKQWDYIYNASLTATPLRTLTHTLNFSGRTGRTHEGSFNADSLYLNNTVQLYQGIDVYFSGGVNYAKKETGEKTYGSNLNFGSNILPHRNLSLTLNYSYTTSDQSGGGKPSASTYTSRGDLNVSFSPLRTLYLYGSWSILAQTNVKTSYLQNYAIGWSPFPGGDLQFNFGYTEAIRSEDRARERSIGPSLRWKISTRSALDVSYQWVKSSSVSQKSDTNAFSTRLQIFF